MSRKFIAIMFLSSLLAAIGACSRPDAGPAAPDAGKSAASSGLSAPLQTDRSLVAGPFTFQRAVPGRFGTIRPRFDEVVFELDDPGIWAPGFILHLRSGLNPKDALTSAVVRLNGQEILGPGDFHGEPVDLEVPVALQERNVLGVRIAGNLGSSCEIVIEGELLGELHVRALYPNLSPYSAMTIPLTLRVSCEGWIGDDPDALPQDFRTLMIPAVWNGMPLQTRPEFEAHIADLVTATRPEWSDWQPYAPTVEERSRLYPGLSHGGYYLFAVQVRDAAGRVSPGLGYQREVLHLLAREGFYRPELVVFEETLGHVTNDAPIPVVSGQVLAFNWWASAAHYNGMIATYRHGWDLLDPADAFDPGWSVQPGLDPANLAAEPVAFAAGQHVLTVRAVDDFGQVRTVQIRVVVVPPQLRGLPVLNGSPTP